MFHGYFEGAHHVSIKSMPLYANLKHAQDYWKENSAHEDLPMPELLDYRRLQKETGGHARVKSDRIFELYVYSKELEKLIKMFEQELASDRFQKLRDELKKAAKAVVKEYIVDEWNGARKTDFLREKLQKGKWKQLLK